MVHVHQAALDDAPVVANLIYKLLCELDPGGAATLDIQELLTRTKRVLAMESQVFGFLAFDQNREARGVLMLNACAAIYAGGGFGEITELYVDTSQRSAGAGALLLDAAKKFARARGWSRLEVGAPDMPQWQRTFDFYVGLGFTEVGPRLKLSL